MATVLAISDAHAPFQHKDAWAFLRELKRKYRPTNVVCLGDETDSYALSDYEHTPDGMSAGDELDAAIEQLQPLYRLFPEVSVCISNHGSRYFRKALKHGIPKRYLKEYREALQAPDGWWWEDVHSVDGVDYLHGDAYSGQTGALKCALRRMNSCVLGHTHTHAGVAYAANSKFLIFGMVTGCLVDADKYAFAYQKTLDQKPILGSGIIVDGIPKYVPMTLRPGGEWDGEL